MRALFGVFLVFHGIAHLVGFVGGWRLAPSIPYHTTLLAGRLDVGDGGIRLVGVLWLVLAAAFAASGMGAMSDAPWWRPLTVVAAAASLALSALAWPEAKVGVPLNLLVLALMAAMLRVSVVAPVR